MLTTTFSVDPEERDEEKAPLNTGAQGGHPQQVPLLKLLGVGDELRQRIAEVREHQELQMNSARRREEQRREAERIAEELKQKKIEAERQRRAEERKEERLRQELQRIDDMKKMECFMASKGYEGLGVNAKRMCGSTFFKKHYYPLHDAVDEGDVAVVRALLSARANPMLRSSSGKTPLQRALRRNSDGSRDGVCELLLAAMPDREDNEN